MLCITSLRNEYDTYIRNWFLTQFEGTYCYKNNDNTIGWALYYTNNPLTPQTIELLQYIIKKPHAKH